MIRVQATGSRKDVRNFGFVFAGVFLVLTLYFWYRDGAITLWLPGAGLFFLLGGMILYPLFRPLYLGWMKFALLLAWINTRLILGIAFYLVVTPTGLLLRLFGKDLLNQKIEKDAETYWRKREAVPFDPGRYERLF